MNFLILRDFLEFSEFIFNFKSFKIIKKLNKKGVYFRAGPAWMRRGTGATW